MYIPEVVKSAPLFVGECSTLKCDKSHTIPVLSGKMNVLHTGFLFRKCFITIYTSLFLKPKKVREIELENGKDVFVTRQDPLRKK